MRVPASTYRLQITEEFDLLAAARTLAYLHDLGVDWVYLSPVLASESGSDHGYDVADHSAIDPSRGRGAGLAALSAEARRLGMGVLVDIVPNHVGIARPWENSWWWHVLTHGRESAYASAFDIDWDAGDGRILVPVVGDDDLGEDGRIRNLRVLGGELHYHDQRFPLAPDSADPGPEQDPDAVHARQHYELVHWRRGDAELNYRRFFTITTLAAVRVEDTEWFDRTHEEVARWFADDLVDGLRIDHPDGLRDPGKYLEDLAGLTGGAYVLVEKILEPGEALPPSWRTAGTTGYDALALVDRVLTDPAGEQPLGDLEARLRGGPVDWPALTHETKRRVADTDLLAETRRIARELAHHLPGDTVASDRLEDAVAELLACFPVYRSYLPHGREHLEAAFARARSGRPDLADVLGLVEPVLGDGSADATQRFQQTSGMVMAKGVEDRAFYRWARLTSLNEVGGDPAVFSITPEEFHTAMAERQASWPHAMTAATTHDTKRGEDVRARITVLAEMPGVWERTLDRLLELSPLPDAGFGNLLWQAVVGAWSDDPALRDRLHAYAEKAMREAGDHTTWTEVDADYEAAVHAAVDAAFDDERVQKLLDEVLLEVQIAGQATALAAKLVGLTMPGVPDVYQGTELWDDSLVDPDNRRPVDFEERCSQVALDQPHHPKLRVVAEALRLRRDRPELFTAYEPLTASGVAARHVLAFDRGGAVTVVTRLPRGLRTTGWGDTTLDLPAGRWRNLLTGRLHDAGTVALADLLTDDWPVALLELVREPRRAPGRFDVWAPLPDRLRLAVGDDVVDMERGPGDWWHPTGPVPDGEVDYGYLLDDDTTALPDPRSRRQPHGVHGRSRTFDPRAFAWTDHHWNGRPLAGSVVYELHVGTFTPEGTLDAAIGRLAHLRDLGIDFVELMPVNAFNGEHGWGYDGVLWSAVHEPYGGPEAYQRFVDACHGHGLGVIQDVVHNHLGPSGSYLPRFGPYLVAGDTPWGDQVNLDRDGSHEVRRLVLDSVRDWFTDFHVDGLRLDAVHALVDTSDTHLLEELATETAATAAHLRKPLFVVAESDLNDPHLITPREAGGLGLDAQWSDDFHHALHVALTGETDGYYADFEPLSALAKVCQRGFFHDGTWSSFRGRDHGVPIDTATVPTWRLVVCSQNHDQVGNRARGDRLTEQLDEHQLGSAALLTLGGPFTPMLFQGEEWGASAPFAFFTSHPEPGLGQAVSEGRLAEFARMGWDADAVPDPQDPETYRRSQLDWSEPTTGRHARLLERYRRLLALRRAEPALTDPAFSATSCSADETSRLFTMHRGDLVAVVNFGGASLALELEESAELLFATGDDVALREDRLDLPAHAGALLRGRLSDR